MNSVLILASKSWLLDALRFILALIDWAIYSVTAIILRAIFQLANFELVGFFEGIEERVYVILGIFMLFKVTISLITYLVNPDKISDKEQGMSKVVVRIITVLVMLIMLPTFFNLMTELQNKLLPVVPRIIVGTSNTLNSESVYSISENMALTMVQAFAHKKDDCDGEELSTLGDFLDSINDSCSSSHKKTYRYDYLPIISSVVGLVMCYCLFSMAISVAIRAIKLIILRMIAPIPIISYIDPKSSKDGAFSHWTKTFVSTWAELFINLGMLYFIVYIVDFMLSKDAWKGFFSSVSGNGILSVWDGAILLSFLVVGLFMFAKSAPKFIFDALGIKSKGNFVRMLGMGAATVGGVGAARAAYRARNDYDAMNGQSHRLRNFGASLFSGAGSVAAGGNAILSSDKPNLMTGFDAQAKNNATALSRINAGSTLGGRLSAMGQTLFAGETTADRNERKIKAMEDFNKSLGAIGSRAKDEMVKSMDTKGAIFKGSGLSVNYKSFKAAMDAAASQGKSHFNYTGYTKDANGNWVSATYTMSMEQANNNIGYIQKMNEDDYIRQVIENAKDPNKGISDAKMQQFIVDAEEKATTITRTGNRNLDNDMFGYVDSQGVSHAGIIDANGKFHVSGRDSVKTTQEALEINTTKLQRENNRHVANRRGQGNKGN